MLVRDVMTSPAVTVRPEETLATVAGLLDEHDVSALPVVDENDRLVGMVGEADVVRDAVPPDPWAHDLHPRHPETPPTRTRDVMTLDPVTVTPDTDLPVTADLLAQGPRGSLPVVEDGVVVGVVSRRDLVTLLAHRDREVEASFRAALGEPPPGWSISVEDGVVVVRGVSSTADRRRLRALVGTIRTAAGVRFP